MEVAGGLHSKWKRTTFVTNQKTLFFLAKISIESGWARTTSVIDQKLPSFDSIWQNIINECQTDTTLQQLDQISNS